MRHPTPDPPAELGSRDGLAYALFLPPQPPKANVLILHGADSQKENHYDVARVCRAAGMAAVAFDQRGHGESDGLWGASIVADHAAMAALMPAGAPLVLRGSSLGGYLAITTASALDAAAVIAICPAPSQGLASGMRAGRFSFAHEPDRAADFFAEYPLREAMSQLEAPVLLLHAEADEVVPVEISRKLSTLDRAAATKLIEIPGGHHRSIQHDAELQGVAVRWALRELRR